MSKLKRYFAEGQSYFVTAVLYRRMHLPDILFDPLFQSITKMATKHDSLINAWVLLPDHIHLLVTPSQNILDRLIHDIKLSFGVTYRKSMNINSGRLWQRRYWDHIIRDQEDMNRHIDYIHFNPVRHGLVNSPFKWTHSSIHDFKKAGYYTDDWGVIEELAFDGEYGE